MTYSEIRNGFLGYFKSKGHLIVPSASLIPDDPTLLFTVAGMVPWKAALQGLKAPPAPRVANSQKCLRAGGKHNDLEDVGFNGRHHTFFEMLGNWSFGDYFKDAAIEYSWELLTKVFGLDPARIIVTTHFSDDAATEIWKKVAGKDAIRLGDKSNWWAAGDTGPCGPCTEMFYDFGSAVPGGLPGSPDEDGGRYVEIWNDVFMQFDRDANGNLTSLPAQNVDTGMGLERMAAVLQGKLDNYDTDLFAALKSAVSDLVGVKESAQNKPSFKIITDHLRSVSFAIADGVVPGNDGRGYVVRRLLRRAMRHGQIIGRRGTLLSELYPALVTQMGAAYPELIQQQVRVVDLIRREEHAFEDMLDSGMKLLDKETDGMGTGAVLNGAAAFKLYDTYGFPLDLTQMILRDRGISVDVPGFEASMQEQKDRSKTDAKGTKTLWESRTDLPPTDDKYKYDIFCPPAGGGNHVLAILKGEEFVDSAVSGDEVEVVLEHTRFYGTKGGQVGDTGEIMKGDVPAMNVVEAFHVRDLVVHKGIVTTDLSVGDVVRSRVNGENRAAIVRAHTAAHLLQAALRLVLGEDTHQKGAKVSPDSVRFDFSFERKMTDEEVKKTEEIINDWIAQKIPVENPELDIESAKKIGAMCLEGHDYGDKVRVVIISNKSVEMCGGTHATNTGDIMGAKINKEKAIASGIRRITMSVGKLV